MNDNEKLIEEARTWATRPDEYQEDALIVRLADALEAAEKAHTSTGDERLDAQRVVDAIRQVMTSVRDTAPSGRIAVSKVDRIARAEISAQRLRITEPQGEPSDAQVLAALNAYGPESATDDLSDYHEVNRDAMRNALRAAGGVR